MGTSGDNAFAIKVSADGTVWNTGLSFDPVTGRARAPAGMQVTGAITGTAVTQSGMDGTAGRLMKVGDFGLGAILAPVIADIDNPNVPFGQYRTVSPTVLGTFPGFEKWGHLINFGTSQASFVQLYANIASDTLFMRRYRASDGGWKPWRSFLNTANTTVDVNGFVRAASPIVQLSDTGSVEPAEPVGATFEKVSLGQYRLHNVAPLASSGWSIEIPRDINGNRQIFVDLAYDAAQKVLDVHTSVPFWDGYWQAGAVCDIPQDRWIDLRFTPVEEEDAQTEGD
jgi:hypothetical protein